MEWMKNTENRIMISLLAGLLAVVLLAGEPGAEKISAEAPYVYAWWGTLFPEFCFEEGEYREEEKNIPEEEADSAKAQRPRRKISFWLAKVLDW